MATVAAAAAAAASSAVAVLAAPPGATAPPAVPAPPAATAPPAAPATLPTPPQAPHAPPPAPAAPAAVELPSATEIIDRFEAAIGGRERWLRDHSRTLVYAVDLRSRTEQGGVREAQGTLVVKRKAPDRMVSRLEVTEVGVFVQGYDGTRGWSIRDGGAPRMLEGGDLAERRRESLIDRDIRLREIYPTMEVIAAQEFDGRPCWVVRMRADDGSPAQAWFDRESGFMLALARMLNFGGNPQPVRLRFGDWREHDGQWFAERIEQSVGTTTQVSTLRSIDHECIEDSEFELPEAPKSPDAPTPTTPDAPAPPPLAAPVDPAPPRAPGSTP